MAAFAKSVWQKLATLSQSPDRGLSVAPYVWLAEVAEVARVELAELAKSSCVRSCPANLLPQPETQRPRDPVLMPLHTSHYKQFQAWPLAALNWKPAQLSLTSLHPLQGSQPTNQRVGCNHQATKIDVCFGSCQRNKSSHENSDILEMLLVSFRYERRLSHSPNSKPASIDVSKHGAKRISRNRSIYKYHFLYWCCIRHPKSTHTHSQWIPLTGLAFNRFEFESGASLLEASALVETGATVTDVSASTAGLSTYKQESRVQPPGHENWRLFRFMST